MARALDVVGFTHKADRGTDHACREIRTYTVAGQQLRPSGGLMVDSHPVGHLKLAQLHIRTPSYQQGGSIQGHVKYALRLSKPSHETIPFHAHMVGEDMKTSPCKQVNDEKISISHLESGLMPWTKKGAGLGVRGNPRLHSGREDPDGGRHVAASYAYGPGRRYTDRPRKPNREASQVLGDATKRK